MEQVLPHELKEAEVYVQHDPVQVIKKQDKSSSFR